jgi:hypothetical protein
MNLFVQYHNVAQEGLPLAQPPFSETRLGIHTRRPSVQNAKGRVFLVAGLGKPMRTAKFFAFLALLA